MLQKHPGQPSRMGIFVQKYIDWGSSKYQSEEVTTGIVLKSSNCDAINNQVETGSKMCMSLFGNNETNKKVLFPFLLSTV